MGKNAIQTTHAKGNFTWFHLNGRAMSRIDRAFLSDEWISLWGSPSLWINMRDVSDHCPVVLRYNNVDWGPRPFRFNNHWLLHKDFKSLVEDWWGSNSIVGWMGFVLKEKLKGLKVVIKAWNKEVYGAIDSKISRLIVDIQDLDVKGELVLLSEAEVLNRKKLFSDLWHLLKSKDSMIVQRSRARWLKEGDDNTRYFHKCLKARGSCNTIRALHVGGVWVDASMLLRQATVDFFTNQFCSHGWSRPYLDGIAFPTLSGDDNVSLTMPFTLEEIEAVVMGTKARGRMVIISILSKTFGAY
jgi:hypothetical protein